MELTERRRLTKALGLGTGTHLLILLLFLFIPMENREEKIPLGAIRVELGPGTDSRAGEKAGGTPAPVRREPLPAPVQPAKPAPASPASRPAPASATATRAPADKPAAAPVPAPAARQEAGTPQPKPEAAPSPSAPASARPSQAEASRPSPPAPADSGLRASSQATAAAENREMEGLDLLAGLSDLGQPSQGQSPAEGLTKFEAGAGNPVELEDGVVNARPLPLVAPVAPDGTPPGELEVRFIIGSGGLVKLSPESLQLRGLKGNIAQTPVTSEEWIRLRAAVEKALSRWTFLTDGREIKGRVVFTIRSR